MGMDRRKWLGWSCAAAAIVSTPAWCQQDVGQAAKIRKNFDDCFYFSAAEQFKNPAEKDVSAVAERAFLACQTEQDAILAFLTLSGAPPAQSQSVLIGAKL